jgi:hypothetical protein
MEARTGRFKKASRRLLPVHCRTNRPDPGLVKGYAKTLKGVACGGAVPRVPANNGSIFRKFFAATGETDKFAGHLTDLPPIIL